jgi:hypothetical protein
MASTQKEKQLLPQRQQQQPNFWVAFSFTINHPDNTHSTRMENSGMFIQHPSTNMADLALGIKSNWQARIQKTKPKDVISHVAILSIMPLATHSSETMKVLQHPVLSVNALVTTWHANQTFRSTIVENVLMTRDEKMLIESRAVIINKLHDLYGAEAGFYNIFNIILSNHNLPEIPSTMEVHGAVLTSDVETGCVNLACGHCDCQKPDIVIGSSPFMTTTVSSSSSSVSSLGSASSSAAIVSSSSSIVETSSSV